MPRLLSNRGLAATLVQHTEEAFILLITLTYVPTGEVFRAALNTENIVSNGNVFTATYFEVSFPEISDKAPQGLQLSMDNVDMRLIGLLRGITTPLQVTVQLVLGATPDIVEMEFTDLVLREVDWNASTITGTLSSEDPLNQSFPAHMYDPRSFEGIF